MINLKKIFFGLGIAFVFLVFASFKYSESKEIGFNNSQILSDAKSIFDKDITFRRWVAMHGGVYVPITQKTPPNQYLAHIPNRDITTTTGMKLTLMNPAYALRQFMNDFQSSYAEKGKITSLKLINPNNAPDAFEKAALEKFDASSAAKEHYKKIKNTQGQNELRYIKPLIVRESCLKCHSHQGYKVGDVRGGISITLSLEKYEKILNEALDYLKTIHLFALFFGILFLYFTYLYLKKAQIQENKLNKQISEVYTIFNSGSIVLFRWNNDEHWSIDYVSDNVQNLLGYTKKEFMDTEVVYASLIDEEDIQTVTDEVL
ncbi:MAG: DUF3365 domain-containing protein, partial [Campylobacterota bacterium]|nr:DUF3365 domain-containing protein [Campylobacterota bacterium]